MLRFVGRAKSVKLIGLPVLRGSSPRKFRLAGLPKRRPPRRSKAVGSLLAACFSAAGWSHQAQRIVQKSCFTMKKSRPSVQ